MESLWRRQHYSPHKQEIWGRFAFVVLFRFANLMASFPRRFPFLSQLLLFRCHLLFRDVNIIFVMTFIASSMYQLVVAFLISSHIHWFPRESWNWKWITGFVWVSYHHIENNSLTYDCIIYLILWSTAIKYDDGFVVSMG